MMVEDKEIVVQLLVDTHGYKARCRACEHALGHQELEHGN